MRMESMTKNSLPKSVRAHIRREKARLRKRALGSDAEKNAVRELYARFGMPYSESTSQKSKGVR